MHRNHGFCARGDGLPQTLRIHGASPVVNIHKHRRRATETDRLCGSNKRVGHGDNLIPWANPMCQHDQPERIGPITNPERIASSTKCSKFLLEFCHKRPPCKRSALKNTLHCGANLIMKHAILSLEIQKRNVHGLYPPPKFEAPVLDSLSQSCLAAHSGSRHCQPRQSHSHPR